MPTYKPRLPAAIDPKTAKPSDPLYQTLLKKAVDALGLDEPQLLDPTPMGVLGRATGPLGRLLGRVRKAAPRAAMAGETANELTDAYRRLPPEFTPVGAEPPVQRPAFPDPVDPIYRRILENKGRR